MKKSDMLWLAHELVERESTKYIKKGLKATCALDRLSANRKASEYGAVNKWLYDEYHKAKKEEDQNGEA